MALARVAHRGGFGPVQSPVLLLTLRYAQYVRHLSTSRRLLGYELGRDGPLRVAIVRKRVIIRLRVDSQLPILELDVNHLARLLFIALL